MIKRRKLVTQQDSIRQGSLTAQKGIDLSKAPIQSDTMADIVNFDVDDDGGLILRKPLLLAGTVSTNGLPNNVSVFVGYAYDGTRFAIATTPSDSYIYFSDGSLVEKTISDQLKNAMYLPNMDVDHTPTGWYLLKGKRLLQKYFNTASTTVLFMYDNSERATNPLQLYRYTNVYTDGWVLVRKDPEPNTIIADDEIPFNPNLMLPDPNVVNDDTTFSTVRVSGMVLYALGYMADDFKSLVVLKSVQLHTSSSPTDTYTTVPWSTSKVNYTFDAGNDWYFQGGLSYVPIDQPLKLAGAGSQLGVATDVCLKLFVDGIPLKYEEPEANEQFKVVVWERTTDGVTYTPIKIDDTTNINQLFVFPDGVRQSLIDHCTVSLKRPVTILSEYDGTPITAQDVLDKGLEVKYETVQGYIVYPGTLALFLPADWISEGTTIRATVYSTKDAVYALNAGSSGLSTATVRQALGSRSYTIHNYVECTPYTARNPVSGEYMTYENLVRVSDRYSYVTPVSFRDTNLLYHNSTIYNFGKGLKNVIYPSDTGSFITPLYNQIDLSTNEDSTVNALIPWRNCLIAMTDTAVYRIVKTDTGYATATVSTFTGVPARDAHTAKAILNGIIFKSHEKVYTLYPNTYSEDENILRLSEISTPVAKYVTDSETDTSFAIATPSEYLLFTRFGGEERTQCLRYSYSTRVWSRYIFKVALIDYNVRSVTDIRLFGTDYRHEYYFDKLIEEVVDTSTLTSPELYDNITYGDWLTTVVNSDNVQAVLNGTMEPPVTPFEFTVDSGQKSDAMGIVKQFVETKATYTAQSDNADFPTELSLYIDGDEHPLQLEEATDAAVQRGNQNSLVLGTEVHTASASLKDTTVRYFAKHSGKGKSIRYVLKGKSTSRFKLYEIAYRYRLPRSKQ